MGNTGDVWGTYIKLYRKLADWEWYTDIPTKVLFIHFLIIASWNPGCFKGETIERGELVRSLHSLSTETGLTIAQCRTAISHLISTNDITIRNAGKVRIIRVTNFVKYQADTNDDTNLARKSHDGAQQNRTNQRSKIAPKSHRSNKDKKDNKDKERKESAPAPLSSETERMVPDPSEGWGFD